MPRRVSNPPNPWQSVHVEWIGPPPEVALEVHEEDARSVLSENDSPDVPFRWSLNPYRGCFHGCAYCYARPTHQYLGWGAGTDFDRRLVVKRNAPERLRAELMAPRWRGERIAFSGVTDCYQPLEASYRLTRACLEVCRDVRNPVVVVTKGALVRRDADVLVELASVAHLVVYLSIPFADDALSAALEPWANPVSQRLAALRELSAAGVRTGVAVAPIIPGLNDSHVPAVLERAADAGARHAFAVALRLPREVAPVFTERLREAMPRRAERVLAAVREMRGGRLDDAAFGRRMTGRGARWQAIDALFDATCRRLGLSGRDDDVPDTFRRPTGQRMLFGD